MLEAWLFILHMWGALTEVSKHTKPHTVVEALAPAHKLHLSTDIPQKLREA